MSAESAVKLQYFQTEFKAIKHKFEMYKIGRFCLSAKIDFAGNFCETWPFRRFKTFDTPLKCFTLFVGTNP